MMWPMPPAPSRYTQRLAGILLGGSLEEFVRSRRPERGWRLIHEDLLEATDGEINVSHETLRSWYPDAVDREHEPLAESA